MVLGYSTRIRGDQVPGEALKTAPSRPRLSSLLGAPCPDDKECNCADSPSLGASGTRQQSEPPETASHAHPSASRPVYFRPFRSVQIRASRWFPIPAPKVTGVGAGPDAHARSLAVPPSLSLPHVRSWARVQGRSILVFQANPDGA